MTINATKVVQTTETIEDGDLVVRRARDPFEPSAGADEVSRTPAAVLDDPLAERIAALEAKAETLQALLVDKGVIAEADVAVALEAATEQVAIKR